jgi:TolB protein
VSGIAYVGHDGQLRTCDVAGEARRPVSEPGMCCTWPTWSPGGHWLAFSAHRASTNGHGSIGVYIVRPDGTELRLVYGNQFGSGDIAPATPHYALWSPDGEELAFIAQTLDEGLVLFRYRPDSGEPPGTLVKGGPLYFAWSRGSDSLMVHSSRRHHLVRLSPELAVRQVPGVSTLYMAPSSSPGDERIAMFMDAGNNRQRLVVLDLKDDSVKVLLELEGIASCAWKPDGLAVAVARDMRGSTGFYDGLWLVDAATGSSDKIIDDPVLAFFWSPDGSRLAYITSSEDAEGSLRWAVSSVSSRDTAYLSDFRPSQEQLISFMFFDQYCQSHTPWSPDGSLILFVGELGSRTVRTPLSSGESNNVHVVPADGKTDARKIAPGFVGCWAPQ